MKTAVAWAQDDKYYLPHNWPRHALSLQTDVSRIQCCTFHCILLTWLTYSSLFHFQSPFRKKFHSTLHEFVGNYMLNANSPNAQFRVSISSPFHIVSLGGDSPLFNTKQISLFVFFFFLAYKKVLNMVPWSLFYHFYPPTLPLTFLTFKGTLLSRHLCLNIWTIQRPPLTDGHPYLAFFFFWT